MDEAGSDLGFGSARSIVSLPSTPSPSRPRRLSSCYSAPSRPVENTKMAWVSLQGRLVNAEEASSAWTIKGGLSREESFAWELFSPVERFLIVAVLGVAAAESKKNRQISALRKSVEIRDQVLSSMQQKLEDLYEQMNASRGQTQDGDDMLCAKNGELPTDGAIGFDKIKSADCGCWLCEQHRNLSTVLAGNSIIKLSTSDDELHYKMPSNCWAEAEERRMSDLSDWASSVTSYADAQMNSLTTEQDICNLKKECEEKDTTIKELTALLHSSEVAGAKRMAELEDIIRRKNAIITKLRKDQAVLEQKVVQLTRLRRHSSVSVPSRREIPLLTDNVLFDMDSTSPSSSDSDSSPINRPQTPIAKVQESASQCRNISIKSQKLVSAKSSSSSKEQSERKIPQPLGPLKEISPNQRCELESSKQKPQSAGRDYGRSRRQTRAGLKDATPKRRWV